MDNNMFKFEVHLNEHCNLNCKCCDHFSPISKEEYSNFNSIEKDFKRMKELLGDERNVSIYLLGGEPLLNPKIIDYINMARGYFPDKDKHIIRIVTNGILLPKQKDEFWKACNENDILIAPTHYPIDIDYNVINSKADEFGVKIQFFHSDEVVEYMYNIPLHLEKDLNKEESFSNCIIASRCVFVKDGYLYACPRMANIHHFNEYYNKNLQLDENDYINIYNINSYEDIVSYLTKPKAFCAHCNTKNTQKDVKWCISKKEMKDWVSDY